MDTLILARIQYALNIGFHYLYPPISIGLGLILIIMEGLYLKTKDRKYKEMTQFWINIFSLTFALGVATGIVQTFTFGTNWAKYSRFVGDVFGGALAAEGIFAFFLEAGFLGVLLFGWDRVGPKLHYLSTICVSLGAHFSALWILVANSWMQTPAGYRIVDTPLGPRAEMTHFWEAILNPSTLDRITHTILGCWLTGAFFVISVAAYYYLKRRHDAIARPMMKIGLSVALVSLLLQLASGHSSAQIVAKYQPAKLAAFEGLYTTEPHTPMSVIGNIKIPSALSLLVHGDLKTPVTGLDQIPRDEWPNVRFVFQTYHIMLYMWGIMMLLTLFALYYFRKNQLHHKKWLLYPLIFSVLLPHIVQQCGWISAEVGRQPWIVYKLLRTADGVSKTVSASQLWGSMTMFVVIYTLLFILFLFLLDRKIKHGPTENLEEVYSKGKV